MKTRIKITVKGHIEENGKVELSKEDLLDIKNSITSDLVKGGMKGVITTVVVEYVEE